MRPVRGLRASATSYTGSSGSCSALPISSSAASYSLSGTEYPFMMVSSLAYAAWKLRCGYSCIESDRAAAGGAAPSARDFFTAFGDEGAPAPLEAGAASTSQSVKLPSKRVAVLTSSGWSSSTMAIRSPPAMAAPSVSTHRNTPASPLSTGMNIFITSISANACLASMCSPSGTSCFTSFPATSVVRRVGSYSLLNRYVCPSSVRRRPEGWVCA
mmetsp:Transcript_27637/g.55650  ORF Transcript_27637/g.55650 Transcript_27637/m.55650 type:complete len:214 (+) Transcript_27637:4708-5349(+)